jgi:alpha-beta hydrolase superfamily lysophospholipase
MGSGEPRTGCGADLPFTLTTEDTRGRRSALSSESLYRPERAGDWGTPAAIPGGEYGTATLARPDGISLFFRFWRQPDAQAPVLVLLHGLGAHTGWFIDMGNALHERGLTVYAVDHRGFGRSGGPRGHVRRGAVFIDDAEAFLAEVRRRQPGAPLVLLGHSMGGLFALNVAARDARSGRNQLAGLILLNPWIRDTSKATPGAVLSVLIGGPLGSRYVPPSTAGSDTSTMTTNPEATRMLQSDTYWVRGRSVAFYYQIALRMRGQALRRARAVRAPALVIQGGNDRAVDPAATRRCFEALGSPDKTYKSLPGFDHDCELQPERGPLDDEIAGWIARHMV